MHRKALERLNQRLAKKGVRMAQKRLKVQDDSSDSDDGQVAAHSDSVVAAVKMVARQYHSLGHPQCYLWTEDGIVCSSMAKGSSFIFPWS